MLAGKKAELVERLTSAPDKVRQKCITLWVLP